jgi:hypothetical protein
VQNEVAQKKKELEDKQKQKSGEKWYALIPYDGPHGTRRRPIYIECTDIGIVLQPEGVVLLPDDFRGPLGPGNPLDAALRTIRERIAQEGGKAGEPYPLIVAAQRRRRLWQGPPSTAGLGRRIRLRADLR